MGCQQASGMAMSALALAAGIGVAGVLRGGRLNGHVKRWRVVVRILGCVAVRVRCNMLCVWGNVRVRPARHQRQPND